MLISAADAELAALVVAGIDPGDFGDPEAVLEGLESVGFVISLEARASLVTERANVVFPVSLIHERAGTFVNWEGRHRSFDVVISQPNGMSDLRVLAALADGLDSDLGFRTAAQARAELLELGAWDGERSEAPDYPALLAAEIEPAADEGPIEVVLATWRMALDHSRALDGEPNLQATAPEPVARVSRATAAAAGLAGYAEIANDRGSLRLPVVIEDDMADGVVWVPGRARGFEVPWHLAAGAGDVVRISPAESLPAPVEPKEATA
jgi:NADH-quinone oxidoreductase subunit G